MLIISFNDEAAQQNETAENKKSSGSYKKHNFTKTISIKRFINEFGVFYSTHMCEKLMELELRTVLTRTDILNALNIKHVEHTKYSCNSDGIASEKELVFGQLISIEGNLYFCADCDENETAAKCTAVDQIFNSICGNEYTLSSGAKVKKIDDSNIDALVDSLLKNIPDVSDRYMKILKEMTSYEK